MEVRQYRSRAPEPKPRLDEQTGLARRRVAFDGAHAGSADGDHAGRVIHAREGSPAAPKALRMQVDVLQNLGVKGLKCSQPDVQRHVRDGGTGALARIQNFRREMQPGGGRGHRPAVPQSLRSRANTV